MKSFFLYAAITSLTFAVGVGFVTSLTIEPFPASESVVVDSHSPPRVVGHDLTFENNGAIADGRDPAGAASYQYYKASDGALLNTTFIYRITNEPAARKRFKSELRRASRILQQTDYRAVIETGSGFCVVEWGKDSQDSGFTMSIVEAPSLKHLTDFEKQQTAFATSLRVDRLTP